MVEKGFTENREFIIEEIKEATKNNNDLANRHKMISIFIFHNRPRVSQYHLLQNIHQLEPLQVQVVFYHYILHDVLLLLE